MGYGLSVSRGLCLHGDRATLIIPSPCPAPGVRQSWAALQKASRCVAGRGNGEHSTCTTASFSFYLRRCPPRRRAASPLTPFPFMPSAFRRSDAGLGGMDFLAAIWKPLFLLAAVPSRLGPPTSLQMRRSSAAFQEVNRRGVITFGFNYGTAAAWELIWK